LIARNVAWFSLAAALAAAAAGCQYRAAGRKGYPVVVIETSAGTIQAELWPDKAPISVENFLRYVDEGFYDETVFHRCIRGFMVQGGGFTKDMRQKATRGAIKNEAANGLKNRRGTLAMARISKVDSATAQFFINTADNDFLDHGVRDFGYAVFGQVTDGMDVVDKIERAPLAGDPQDGKPANPVVILSIRRALR
jgi:peptidyl-prolyl cis-trans isomerase A (cyclophilin A)